MSADASIAPPAAAAARRWTVLVILAAAALYLVGNGGVSLWDRDEPRYAQCARQMLFGSPDGHGPDLVVPRYLDHLRTEKPPLIYWLQVASIKVFGDGPFAVRFPSSLAMVIVLTVMAVLLDRAIGPVRAAWAVFVMASSALTIMSAKMCLTDATLLVFNLTALACTYAVYRGNRSWLVTIVLWVALGLGGLTKGPIVLAVLGATLVVLAILDRLTDGRWNLRWMLALRPWVGLPIVALIVTPWLVEVNRRAPEFLRLLRGAAARHLASESEKHAAPPGYYVVAIWGLLFPWSLLLPMTLAVAWRNRREPIVRYALAVTSGVWLFQECMKAKLPFYVLPAFPALAVLTADAIVRGVRREHDHLARRGFPLAVSIWTVAVVAIAAAPWIFAMPKWGLRGLLPTSAMVAMTVAGVLFGAVVLVALLRRRFVGGFIAMGAGTMALFALLFAAFLPHARFLQLSEAVAARLRAHGATRPGDVIMIEYKEPSLAYYQGGTIVEQPKFSFFSLTPPEQWPTWAVLPRTIWEQKVSAEAKAKLEVVGEPLRGLDYAGKVDGRHVVDVLVVRKREDVITAVK